MYPVERGGIWWCYVCGAKNGPRVEYHLLGLRRHDAGGEMQIEVPPVRLHEGLQ